MHFFFYIGNAHGCHEMKSFVFTKPVNLKTGHNYISILGVLTGLPVSIYIHRLETLKFETIYVTPKKSMILKML